MKRRSHTDQRKSAVLMWDWIWPAFVLLDLPFGACFIILPNPTLTKLLIATTLILIHLGIAYWVRYQRQLARIWQLFGAMTFFNLASFTVGLAIHAYFRFHQPSDIGQILLIIATALVGVAYLTWRYYTPHMKPLLEADCQTGRFDLEQGTFSLFVPPSLFESQNLFLRKMTAILVILSGFLIAISAASGVHGGHDGGLGALSLFIAAMSIFTVTCSLYTYYWIRQWEEHTGRTMWIKGFELYDADFGDFGGVPPGTD